MEPDPTQTVDLPPPTRHLRLLAETDAPENFVKMKLVLQPSGAIIEVLRPNAMVGRHTEADIRLPLPDVSRRHCRLVFSQNGWEVVDLNSLNGITVNGEQVLQAPLDHGDLLRIGGFTFMVELSAKSEDLDSTDHVQSIARTLAVRPHRRAS